MQNLILPAILLTSLSACTSKVKEPSKPNIIIIYADDLGFGDIGVNGAKGVSTPNIDLLSKYGTNFVDAHSSASTCTPSRFSLLTGSYAFRANAAILPGDAPLLIDPNKGTLPSMLKKAGYSTAVIGKWHLGLGYGKTNWNEEIKPGPREIGFDYSFLIPATGDRVPCVFVENQKVAGLDPNDPIEISYGAKIEGVPTGLEYPDLMRVKADQQHSVAVVNGISRIGYMKGGKSALWVDENFPFVLTEKAKSFIKSSKNNPFFLYFSFHDIHVPRVPNKKFQNASTMGARGDAIAQMDWCTGEIINMLKELGIEKNTLVIFSSDNGPVLDDGYDDKAVEMLGDHNPSGIYRGGKYSAFEAGTRMPTIVYWPGVVASGTSNALMTQVDIYASLAHLVGQPIEVNDAPDSQDMLDAWLGKTANGRKVMLEEAFTFSLRDGDWKYINPQEAGTPDWMKNKNIEGGLSNEVQLYNLKDDPSEKHNIAAENPEKVAEMQQKLKEIRTKNNTKL